MFACFGFVAFSTFTNDKISLGLKKEPVQCRSKGNISGGGGAARERRRREPLEGSGGMLPQKILKSRGLDMPFPAFSKSYL